MMIFSSKQTDIISRMWFDFVEPFDTQEAIHNLNYGGKATLDYKHLLFTYHLSFTMLYDLLNAVYDPPLKYAGKTHAPTKEAIDDYFILYRFIKLVEHELNKKFVVKYWYGLHSVNFSGMERIEGDQERLLKVWRERKGSFEDYIALIKEAMLHEGVKDYKLPYRLQFFKDEVSDHLSKITLSGRSKSDTSKTMYIFPDDFTIDPNDPRIYHFGERGEVEFTAQDSKRKQIFDCYFKARGDWVKTQTIVRQIDEVDNPYVRQVVRELRKILAPCKMTIEFNYDTTSQARLIPSELATSKTHSS